MNPLAPTDTGLTSTELKLRGTVPEGTVLGGSGQVHVDEGTTDARAGKSREFEEILLKQFVEELLPKDCEAFYGKGPGSGIWRSMMADGIAHQLALRELLSLKPL